MTRGLKRFPNHVYARPELMEKIRVNWKHHFMRNEEVWVLDRPKREVAGPFKFAHYSKASAVVLFEYYEGRFGSRRVYFLKDQVMYTTKKEAQLALGSLKVLDFLEHQRNTDALINEIEELLGKQIADTMRKHLCALKS